MDDTTIETITHKGEVIGINPRFQAVLAGFQILSKYVANDTEVSAGHSPQQIWISMDEPETVSPQDQARLEELGWYICNEYGATWSCTPAGPVGT